MAAEFYHLAHAIAVAFEANLAYSVVVNLGNLAGASINSWIDNERVRVVPAMCETPSFDEAAFVRDLEKVRDKYSKRISSLTWWCLRGAFGAAGVAAALLILMPFFPHVHVDPLWVVVGSVALFGSIGAGIGGMLYLHRRAGSEMRAQSKVHDAAIALFKQAPADRIAAATDAFLKRLEAEKTSNHRAAPPPAGH